jgi:hypothetical protein
MEFFSARESLARGLPLQLLAREITHGANYVGTKCTLFGDGKSTMAPKRWKTDTWPLACILFSDARCFKGAQHLERRQEPQNEKKRRREK